MKKTDNVKNEVFTTVQENENAFSSDYDNTSVAPIMRADDSRFIVDLTAKREDMFCSIKAETRQEKALLFKAINNPDKRIADCINMTINAKDLFCEVVQVRNEDTEEVTSCPRIVIIDDTGVAYQSVSVGVYSGMKKLIQIYGTPTWDEPLPLIIKQITKGKRSLLTFDVTL